MRFSETPSLSKCPVGVNRSRNTSGVVAAVAVAGFAVAGYVFWKKLIKSQVCLDCCLLYFSAGVDAGMP